MREAAVYRNSIYVGILREAADKTYTFEYDALYRSDPNNPAVSLTMPKDQQFYNAPYLFPFFFNMLAEGVNRKMQVRQLQIDDNDHFGLLMATSSKDSIGAITVKEIEVNA